MPTPYSEIYELFLSKITDYEIANLTSVEFEDIVKNYLRSAVIKFKACKEDLSDRDEDLQQFNADLDEEEKEILATLLVVEWLNPKILTTEALKQVLTDKNWHIYSQSAHLKELQSLRKQYKLEAQQLITSYSYNDLGEKL